MSDDVSRPEEDRARLLASLAEELAQARTEESTAAAVTQRARDHVRDADFVSLTVRTRPGRYETLGASAPLAESLDQLQYALREGPCVEAAEGHDWYRSGDVKTDPRWPHWGPQAHDLGVSSLLSVGLDLRGSRIGALNFYATPEGRFDVREEVDFAILYSTHVAIALSSSRELSGLQTALHTRHLIGIAQGILCERYALDMDASFSLLRRYSSITNTKLSQVAADLVRTGRLPDLPRQDAVD